MKIFIASKNPTKVNATVEAFKNYYKDFDVESFSVDTGVYHTPFDDDVLQGAKNRVAELKKCGVADFYVGHEAGIFTGDPNYVIGTLTYIENKFGDSSYGSSLRYPLPNAVVDEIKSDVELSEILGRLTNDMNSRSKGGASEYFSKGVINRTMLTKESVTCALFPFVNKDIYFDN